MVNALLLLGVALIVGSYLFNTSQPGLQRQAIRIDREPVRRRK